MYAGGQGDFVHFFWAVVIIALKGWRVMQACDGAMMLREPKMAEDIGNRLHTARPPAEHPDMDMGSIWKIGANMLAMARECRIKNRDKAVPEGYAEAMPTKGNA